MSKFLIALLGNLLKPKASIALVDKLTQLSWSICPGEIYKIELASLLLI